MISLVFGALGSVLFFYGAGNIASDKMNSDLIVLTNLLTTAPINDKQYSYLISDALGSQKYKRTINKQIHKNHAYCNGKFQINGTETNYKYDVYYLEQYTKHRNISLLCRSLTLFGIAMTALFIGGV